MRLNPYTPGAGMTPRFLSGREEILSDAQLSLNGLMQGYMQRPVIYYGLRGVGKTVILNTLAGFAENIGIQYEHIEAGEDERFTQRFSAAVSRMLSNLGRKNVVSETFHKCKDLIRNFRLTYEPQDEKFAIEPVDSIATTSGVLSDDMMQVIVSLGRAAQASNGAACFFIDEMQYLKEDEVRGLVNGIHRCNQLQLPVTLYCAGLPKVLKYVGDICTYSERLFNFIKVDSLNRQESYAAVVNPAHDVGVAFTDEAANLVCDITEGYPYFIQEFCRVILEELPVEEFNINRDFVRATVDRFYQKLDEGFFSVRFDRCTPAEKMFTYAMVQCGSLPCEISKVAENLGRTNKQISPVRGKLISKGIIYATGHGLIDFTVPQFDKFILRHT